ncbi:tyrosine-protein kinase JAK1-like isoform X2 [Asterias rubens]|uniref:tyrosine-protein kinase JAK1-like isoform X1 n=1 Tax=Asterias rubens TaxID=7604 RepID=UPI001455AB0B|nr:tyrosine-protein kinase JAK1-like isoform X1 [Asterias rubens]XP_033641162.1 tyrosine-protein kinase JAK1-like isoform X2 [Asterias rubens]
MEMQSVQRPVTVFLYNTLKGELICMDYTENLTAEALCIFCAKRCRIPRLSTNLYAIYDGNKKLWLSPGAKVYPEDVGLTFRMRFHMSKSPMNITSLDKNVVGYLFAQYHHDFYLDKIPKITMEETLGLVVLDIVRYANEKNISVQACLGRKHFRKFLPNSLSKKLNILDKWKLKKKIRTSLDEFRRCDQDVNNCHMMFLISLMEEHETWGVEEFETVKGQKFEVSITYKGVKQTSPADQARFFKLFFEDILSVGMMASHAPGSTNWIVLVNQREGQPKEFLMECKEDAESVVSLIDGYCRLQVDFYHYLCPECAPPSLVQLVKNRCHGPIPLSCAKRKIEDAGMEDGIYLIRQNPEDFFSYCLTVRMGGDIKNYKIMVNEVDGSVSLPGQRSFPDVRSLAEHYRRDVNCACLDGPLTKVVSYQPKEDSLHLHDLSMLPEPPRPRPPEPSIEWIKEENMSERRRKLGSGDFTSVYKGGIRKPGKGMVPVAIKCPNRNISSNVQKKFCSSVDMMSSWNNQSIIKFLGIGAKFTLIMEYAPYGSLDRYLRLNYPTVNQNHFISMAVQLVDGLEYLESRKIVHGNISAKNVLVVRNSPQIRVKLGDPMMSKFYHSLPMDAKMNIVRWTAPELLHPNVEPTLESDRWSFGMVVWQIWSLGKIPFEDYTELEVLQKYSRFEFPLFSSSCLEAVNKLIKNCWRHTPMERYTCKQLLREFSSIYLRVQNEDGAEGLYWEFPEDQEDIDLIEEDLSEGEREDDDLSDDNSDDQTLFNNDVSSNPLAQPNNNPASTYNPGVSNTPEQLQNVSRLVKFKGIEKVMEGTLTTEKPLGEGHFGCVYKSKWIRGGGNIIDVAIKVIKQDTDMMALSQFEEEIRRMSQCDHKNIVKVLGFAEGYDFHPLCMVMEYYSIGALDKFLCRKKHEKNPLSKKTKLLFSQQVAQGMAYLGEQKIVHRDLAARNVLVASDEDYYSGPEVKICDFGLARKCRADGYYSPTGQNPPLPVTVYPPESIEEPTNAGRFSCAGDVWGYGILMWEIFSDGASARYQDGNHTLTTMREVHDFLLKGNRLKRPVDCPQRVYSVMLDCWRLEKTSRPKFNMLIQRHGDMLEQDMIDN